MKLLFDQNISYRILKKLSSYFPKSAQIKRLGLDGSTDRQIWYYAKSKGYTIVTYDGDFCDIAALKGSPPKIIWLRIGNVDTTTMSKLLIKKSELIKDFIEKEENKDWACLEIK